MVMNVETAAKLVKNLAETGEFGHPTVPVEIVETHISWVLLTGDYAYKIKKPVDLGFLDFSTLAARHEYCRLELELNRRFAPDLYLDVVPIGGSLDQPVVGAEPANEYAVRMRQFPADDRLDRRIRRGLISDDDMWQFGNALAHLHADSAVMPTVGDSVTAIRRPVEDNFTVLRANCQDPDIHGRLDELAGWCARRIAGLAPMIRDRQSAGFVRDCHGDLHLENLVCIEGRIIPFDCLEFDAALRRIDVMNEVAFLLMDTMHIDRPDLGFSFLNRYLEISCDYSGTVLLPFYCVYRSLVRAKIAALRTGKNQAAEKLRYIELAERIAHPDHEPKLVICRGLSGSGKTYLSRQLLTVMPAIRIRSDIVRKQLHQLGELESSRSPVGEGIYVPSISAKTYQTLARFSAAALTAGYDVIIDATCLQLAERAALRSAAESCGAGFAILDCTAEDRILAARVEQRRASGGDASEADLTVLDWQRSHAQPLSAEEQSCALTVDTGRNLSAREITQRLQAITTKSKILT